MTFNEIQNSFVGFVQVNKIYKGDRLIWPVAMPFYQFPPWTNLELYNSINLSAFIFPSWTNLELYNSVNLSVSSFPPWDTVQLFSSIT